MEDTSAWAARITSPDYSRPHPSAADGTCPLAPRSPTAYGANAARIAPPGCRRGVRRTPVARHLPLARPTLECPRSHPMPADPTPIRHVRHCHPTIRCGILRHGCFRRDLRPHGITLAIQSRGWFTIYRSPSPRSLGHSAAWLLFASPSSTRKFAVSCGMVAFCRANSRHSAVWLVSHRVHPMRLPAGPQPADLAQRLHSSRASKFAAAFRGMAASARARHLCPAHVPRP